MNPPEEQEDIFEAHIFEPSEIFEIMAIAQGPMVENLDFDALNDLLDDDWEDFFQQNAEIFEDEEDENNNSI